MTAARQILAGCAAGALVAVVALVLGSLLGRAIEIEDIAQVQRVRADQRMADRVEASKWQEVAR